MAKELIADLKRDHEKLLSTLDEISDSGGIGTEEGKRSLREARDLMVRHMWKEDRRLYPALEQKAKEDQQVERTLNQFRSRMDEISDDAMEFFDRYGDSDDSGVQFASDAGRLLATLKMRMRREEKRLFPLYA